MGPRPFGRGRVAARRAWSRQVLLQWGRDLSVAEGEAAHRQLNPSPSRFNGAATFRSRKAFQCLPCLQCLAAASMGPRPFGRGRSIKDYSFVFMIKLQWGRDLSVAEGNMDAVGADDAAKLQWGRDLSVAEGPYGPCPPATTAGFNGAATFRSRKAAKARQVRTLHAASMGPRPFGRGRFKTSDRERSALRLLQWGRDLSVAEGGNRGKIWRGGG